MAAAFDPSKFTLGEIAKIEDLSGLSIEQIGDDTAPKGKLLAALVFVSKRRQGDPIKWPECLEMDLPTAESVIGMDLTGEAGDEPNQEAEDDQAPKARKRSSGAKK